MKPEQKSQNLLKVTISKGKMYEYQISEDYHITMRDDPKRLFLLSIGMLGDFAAKVMRDKNTQIGFDVSGGLPLFSAHFFNAFIDAKIDTSRNAYLELLCSATYYLCGLPGSSRVLLRKMENSPDLNANGIEQILHWLLTHNLSIELKLRRSAYLPKLELLYENIREYFNSGDKKDEALSILYDLRKEIYEIGTPRELLFIDILGAVVKFKFHNSVWQALPLYSAIPIEIWRNIVKKKTFISEFWPSQHLIGQAGVFKGNPAVLQLPTSTGKTKATELIIRSSFILRKNTAAVIVAPFKALCAEISNELAEAFSDEGVLINELTDVQQSDYELIDHSNSKMIIVTTPEKLLYIIKRTPEITKEIGLIIYDEGHQFDNDSRGIVFELLLTSLNMRLGLDTQKIMISAVVGNPEEIGRWLDSGTQIVSTANIFPSKKTVGFVSWASTYGRIEFVSRSNPDEIDYFVPRVIRSANLGRLGRERKDRYFPSKDDPNSVGLYLAQKLAKNGGVALYVGSKASAVKISKLVVDTINRGFPFSGIMNFSDMNEIKCLQNLINKNLDVGSSLSICASVGIFFHHGNTPTGLRLAIEHAMRVSKIKFIVCTSTLAQGVNLPVRYIIIGNIYQGKEPIKVRNFHNLIGRAGRSGMYSEGTVLFSDHKIFDEKNVSPGGYKWINVKKMLDPMNQEPCISNLLLLLDQLDIVEANGYHDVAPLKLVEKYIMYRQTVGGLREFVSEFADNAPIVQEYFLIIEKIENFILANLDFEDGDDWRPTVMSLASNTLGYFQADNTVKKEVIFKIFELLTENVITMVPNTISRKIYGRTLYCLTDAMFIESWTNSEISNLETKMNTEELLEILWPLITKFVRNDVFQGLNDSSGRSRIVNLWADGAPYWLILEACNKMKIKRKWGNKRKNLTIDDVVGLFEVGFGFESSLLIGAVIEFVMQVDNSEDMDQLLERLKLFQKQLKYGLPKKSQIILYELGFADRPLSQQLTKLYGLENEGKPEIIQRFKSDKDIALNFLKDYPSYFQKQFEIILENQQDRI